MTSASTISKVLVYLDVTQSTAFACCEFIAQSILVCKTGNAYHSCSKYYLKIYRCWIVWGYNIHVVIVPSILAFAVFGPSTYLRYYYSQKFNWLLLVIWVVEATSPLYHAHEIPSHVWQPMTVVARFALPIIVNVLVTSLIILKLFVVLRTVKATSDEQILGTTGGSTLRHIIFILIESGMMLLSIQFVQLVLFSVVGRTSNMVAFNLDILISGIYQMLNVSIVGLYISTSYFADNMGLDRV